MAAGDTVRMKGDSTIRSLCLDVPSGNAGGGGSQPHPTSLAGQAEEAFVLLYKAHTNVTSSPKGVPQASLTDLCQRRSGQLDSGPCKQPSSVPFFAMGHLECTASKFCSSLHGSSLRHKALMYQGASLILSSTRCSGLS